MGVSPCHRNSTKLLSEVHHDHRALTALLSPLPSIKGYLSSQTLNRLVLNNNNHDKRSAMHHRQIKVFVFIILILFISSSSSGEADAYKDILELEHPSDEVIIQMKGRKLIEIDAMLDYQKDPVPNPAHDPCKGNSCKGGKRL